jgi:aryl-alcohol dehydrogenase-like predicted oxidoreductase
VKHLDCLSQYIYSHTFIAGLALACWNTLASGHIRTDEEEEKRRQTGEHGRKLTGSWERTEDEKKVCKALEQVAKEVGAKHITAGQTSNSFRI